MNLGWFETLLDSSFFTQLLPEDMTMFEPGVWNLSMFGAGVILLLEIVLRLILPKFHQHVGGTLVVGVVFIGVRLGNIFG